MKLELENINELSANDKIDIFEQGMIENLELVDCPLKHTFTDGMYVREIFMKARLIITSKIHKTTHPFNISKGKVLVWTDEEKSVILEAPYSGVTKPNTRRVLYIIEDCIWTTYHCRSEEEITPEQIEARIIEPHINPLIGNKYWEEIEMLRNNLIEKGGISRVL